MTFSNKTHFISPKNNLIRLYKNPTILLRSSLLLCNNNEFTHSVWYFLISLSQHVQILLVQRKNSDEKLMLECNKHNDFLKTTLSMAKYQGLCFDDNYL